MVEIAEVRDRDSLKAYLNGIADAEIRRRTSLRIAYYAAARVLSVALSYYALRTIPKPREVKTAAPVFGALSICGAAAVYPATRIASSSAAYVVDAEWATKMTSDAAADAAAYAVDARSAAAAAAAVNAAVNAASNLHQVAFDVWTLVHHDLHRERDKPTGPLLSIWIDLPTAPDQAIWDQTRQKLEADSAGHWRFWIHWYDRVRAGRDTHPYEMAKVLNKLSQKDWLGDPAILNAKFDPILALYEAEDVIGKTPFGMRIRMRTQKGVLYSEPTQAADLDDVIDHIRQALKDFLSRCRRDKSANQLGAQMKSVLSPLIADLRRDLRRHKSDPFQLFDALRYAQNELQRTCSKEGFLRETAVERLADQLQTAREDIATNSPAVVEQEKKRLAVRLELVSRDQKLFALRSLAGMGANSEGMLRLLTERALLMIMSDDGTDEDKRNAWYFMTAVLPRAALQMHKAEAKAASPEEAKDLLKRLAEHGGNMSKIDKGVDAIQEMSGEGADWMAEVMSQLASGNLWGLG